MHLNIESIRPHDQLLLFNDEDVVVVRTQRWKSVGAQYYRGGLDMQARLARARAEFDPLRTEPKSDIRVIPGEVVRPCVFQD